MSLDFLVTLPWPPSINHLYGNRTGKGRGRYLKPEGKKWRQVAILMIRGARGFPPAPIPSPVSVSYHFWPPDNRRRDFDNLLKATNDALQKSGLIKDDSLIKSGSFRFHEKTSCPCVVIRLRFISQ